MKAATAAENWSDMSSEDMLDLAWSRGLRVSERPLPDLMFGLYSDSMRLILIDSRILEHQRRVALTHELIHAERRDAACTNPHSREELRTIRQTALRLVDPLEYATSETFYEGDSYLISCDLNVTVQVVREYRRYLSEETMPEHRVMSA